MIGRKITDQTVICKVIKPIDYHNNKQQPLPKSDSKNLLYPNKSQFINQNNQANTLTSGRVFGIPSQNVQVDFEFASEHQNQFNRINSNKEDTQKNSTKPDKFAGTRNVTQFFITNKDKPINIEAKKTISSTNNTVTQSKNQMKKDTETPKIQDTNLKATRVYRNSEKQQKKTIQNNKSQIIEKNKSEVIDKKVIINKSVMIQKKNDNYSKSAISNSKQKQISKTKKLEGSKLINPIESQKFIKSRSSKDINLVVPRPNKGLSKEPKDTSVLNNDKVKQIQKQKIFLQNQMSFRAWQQTLEEQSVEIQNYFPGSQHNKSSQSKEIDDSNQQQFVDEERFHEENESAIVRKVEDNVKKQIHQKEEISKDTIRKGVQNLRGKQKVKPVQKRYLSVKEEIEQKLKQKRERLKVESTARQKLNKLVIKPETSNDFELQQGNNISEEEEEEQERTFIPQPISEVKQLQELSKLHTHYNQENVQELNQEEENEFLQKDKSCFNTFEEGSEGLDQQQFEDNNSQLIYNKIMRENDEGINQDVVETMNAGMKYNYVESSDEDEQQNNEFLLKEQIKIGRDNPIQHLQEGLRGRQEQIDFEKYQDYEQTQSQMQKIEANHRAQHKPISEPIKLNPYPKTNEQAFNKTTTQRQDESSQQQQQEENPRLQQYLKRRNLISSQKKPFQQSKPLTLSSHIQPQKIKQLLNNYLLQQSQREVIVQLEEEYLQSSILVKESCQQPYCPGLSPSNNAYSNNDQSVEQSVEYGHDIVVYKNELSDEDQSEMRFQDSSDSEENHQIKQSHLPPFVNSHIPQTNFTNALTEMDQLFSLNLNSLLNKEFIQLNQQTL